MVKEKSHNERMFDHDGFKKRASCVCVRNEFENEVLLISSSKNKNFWVIPGGGIEDNENPEDAAEREVYEEAGVQGKLGRLLGIFEVLENKERKHRTTVYLLIVDKELDEWEENTKFGRIRKWFNLYEAKSELEKHKPVQGSYLSLLKGFEKSLSTNGHTNSHNASISNQYINLNGLSSIGFNFSNSNVQITSSSSSSLSPSNSSSGLSSLNSSPVSSSNILLNSNASSSSSSSVANIQPNNSAHSQSQFKNLV